MLQHPREGQLAFEFSVYNQEVRSLVKENQSHSYYDDQWADIHVHDIIAKDEHEAIELAAKRYPPAEGFIVAGMQLVHIEH